MSITKSYNKHTNTYYAYDTNYVWDENLQKKVQKKVCIGKYDPTTGKIIPNAGRGRPSKHPATIAVASASEYPQNEISDEVSKEISEIVSEMQDIRNTLDELTIRFRVLEQKMLALQSFNSK